MAVIVAASKNKHKIEEIEAITKKFGMNVIPRNEAGVPDEIEIEEDGETFEENSLKKARGIMEICVQTTIADDSGLMVDYLGGAPGVYSARFAGEDGNDEKNNQKLIHLLEEVAPKEKTAKFVSVITLIFPDGETIVARGECPGRIIDQPVGENGFGYDPLFFYEPAGLSFAQMSAESKNAVSHRRRALEALRNELEAEAEKKQ